MQDLKVNRFKNLLVIWYNPKKDSFYYRLVTGFYQDYTEGFINGYGHVIIFVFKIDYEIYKVSLKRRIKRSLISFLEKF